MTLDPMDAPPEVLRLVGRSSSHFTRVAALFAHELGVPFELTPVYDLTSLDTATYGGNPALKIPTLLTATSQVFGAENICRKLATIAATGTHATSETPSLRPALRVVWPEQISDDVARNAQELVWHAMAAQVQLIVGSFGKLPMDNLYFAKGREGFLGALAWLEANIDPSLAALPSPRDVSLFEVTLFCLIEHIAFRRTLPLEPYPKLVRFAADFATRPSAKRTDYRFDPPPRP